MGILLDTGFICGIKIEEDDNHNVSDLIMEKIKWKKFGRVIVPSTVVNETLTLVNMRTRCNPIALNQIESIFWGKERFFEIYPVSYEDYYSIFLLMKKYSNKEKQKFLSFVDASLIYIAQKLNFSTIISFDSHFDGILTRIFDEITLNSVN